jgi:NADH:ubiquinone oxidoreductase subunit K
MLAMEVTDMTFQSTGWLKADAPANMLAIEVTDAVLHLPMGWSKAAAPENISAIVLTDTTFHLLMSALSVCALKKSLAMLLAAAVFHSPMLPYVALAHASSVTQEVAAARTLLFVMHVAQTEPIVHVAMLLNVGQRARKAGVQLA